MAKDLTPEQVIKIVKAKLGKDTYVSLNYIDQFGPLTKELYDGTQREFFKDTTWVKVLKKFDAYIKEHSNV